MRTTQRGTDLYTHRSLWQKLADSYRGNHSDPVVSRAANISAGLYFWFIAFSKLYVMTQYVIPYYFKEMSAMKQYYVKVLAWFVFIQTVANWVCARCYQSLMPSTANKPNTCRQRTIWERHVFSQTHKKELSEADSVQYTDRGWKYCSVCATQVPPRCHHCVICDRCILKRDHHCYMTGVCIGYYNQRYFIILNFYIAVGSFVGLCLIVLYTRDTWYQQSTWFDLVLPVSVWRWAVYDMPLHHMLMVFHLYTLWWTGLAATGFFFWQMFLLVLGKTDHEVRASKRVLYTGSVSESFRSVFGLFWPVNFILPAVLVFRQEGSGLHWKHLTIA